MSEFDAQSEEDSCFPTLDFVKYGAPSDSRKAAAGSFRSPFPFGFAQGQGRSEGQTPLLLSSDDSIGWLQNWMLCAICIIVALTALA
jgi:hypothetical protein